MGVDHILEQFKAILRDKLEKFGPIYVDKSLYNYAKERICMRRGRVDKAINEMAEAGEIRIERSDRSALCPMRIVLNTEAGK